jgi:hypothetical protein
MSVMKLRSYCLPSKIGVSNKGGQEMMKNTGDQEGELIYNMVMKLGQDDFSDRTKATIWAEATRNLELRRLAVNYLFGSSQNAHLNLHKLHTAIMETFFSEVA